MPYQKEVEKEITICILKKNKQHQNIFFKFYLHVENRKPVKGLEELA